MIGKKINQLATELAPTTTDLTIIGDPVTGVSKKITLEQLGAIFGGAVSFYTTLGDFPVTGVIDIIYCAKDTKKLYLWSGSAYVEVFPSQSLLDTYQLRSEKGVSNGYASLDVNGKVPIGQLPNSIMEYKGTWNAATNTPTLANGTGDTGDVYICSVAGTVNFGAGPITFAVGDYVVYSGTIWQRSSGAVGTVTSVAVSNSGDALAITGSPITTSGTINIGFAGTGAQYIKGDGTLATFPSIISQAQNLITEVYNNTGATLTKGTIVYINGGQGNLPTVTKALATSDATSAQTYGVVQTDITNMNNGYVVVEGRLSDLDTQAYANGTQLYLSPTTAGTWTSTKPYAPNHLVYVGIVVRSHPTQGVVEVKIMNGFEMDELHNVAAQSPSNNDILQYKTATSLWTKVAGTTSNIAEGSNLYYTDARSRAALSFTAGSGAYNSTTGVITIPTNTNQLTNGAAFITLTSLAAGAGISYNNTTGVIASTITQYTDAMARAAISLTTTGTSGAATYNSTTGVLNIPNYAPDLSGYVPTSRTLTINGTAFDLSANRSWSVGTVTSVGLSSATSGVTIGSTPITTSGTITLAIATASGSQQGLLSSTDWTTFNNKQNSLTNPVTGTGTTNYLPKFTGTTSIGNSLVYDTGSEVLVGTATRVTGLSGYTQLEVSGSEGGITINSNTTTADKYSRLMFTKSGATGNEGLIRYNVNNYHMSFWTNATEQMRLNASGNLSIGNTNDSFRLDVSGTGRFTSSVDATIANLSLGLKVTGSNLSSGTGAEIVYSSGKGIFLTFNRGAGTYLPTEIDGSTVTLSTSGTPRLNLTASGNLGLGVTPSASADPAFQSRYGVFIGNDETNINNNAFFSSGWKYAQTGSFANRYYQNGYNGGHQWLIAPSGTAGNAISFTQAMTLNASGNLSIGNTNNTYRLDVSGSSMTRGALVIDNNGTDTSPTEYIRFERNSQGSANYFNSIFSSTGSGTNLMQFRLSNTSGGQGTVMTLTGTGNVGIGMSNPQAKFVLQSSANYETSVLGSATANTFTLLASNGLYGMTIGVGNSGNTWFQSQRVDGGTSVYNLLLNPNGGNVAIGTNNPTATLHVNGTIRTSAPTNGTSQPWKLGNAVSGGVTTNHYLVVEINGQAYTINAFNGFP